MNRIAVRLAGAMLLVAIVSLLAVPAATTVAERVALNRLPDTIRARVDELSRPRPPLPLTRDRRQRLPAVNEFDGDVLRLLVLIRDLRQFRLTGSIAGVAVSLLASLLLAWHFSRSLARPIEVVAAAAADVAAGDLEVRVATTDQGRHPTEVQALAENFNAMASSLERLEQERKSMIADVAHELRNPLATLTLRLDAASQGIIELDAVEVATLQSQTQLLTRLVEDLRTLSIVEAGQVQLTLAPLDLQEVLRAAAVAHRPAAARKRVAVRLAALEDRVPVTADRDRLLQVLGNLLENAIRVAPEGSDVKISARRLGERVRVTVQDSGAGFTIDPPERIFHRFVHDARRDERGGGSGLGLAIVRSLVLLHGGAVFAERVGEVTEIGFELPIDPHPHPGDR